MTGLSKHFNDLDVFVCKMKQKFVERSEKHNDNDKLNINLVKLHLIDEFCEVFMLDSVERHIIKDMFINREIDVNELVDMANMCWAMDYVIRNINE